MYLFKYKKCKYLNLVSASSPCAAELESKNKKQ